MYLRPTAEDLETLKDSLLHRLDQGNGETLWELGIGSLFF
jgi:hypothetical protein